MRKKSALALLLLVSSAAVSADDIKRFSANDVFELEIANDPRVSPDGTRIVYERRSNDIMTDGTRSNLWVIGTNGCHPS